MLVRFIKGPVAAKMDSLVCVRDDGTETRGEMPRQGILPHDAFHFVVETTLNWRDAFFGQLAAGASLHGPKIEWSKNVQALQAESLVECLQAEAWGGAADPETFLATLATTCRERHVAPPALTAEELTRVRQALRTFGAAWRPLAPLASLERQFEAKKWRAGSPGSAAPRERRTTT